jgi:spore maturation protein SpmA
MTSSSNPLYRVLALYLPWSVIVTLLPTTLALIHRLAPDLILPSGPALGTAIFIPALLAGAAVTVYLEFLDPRTSHSSAHIRGVVLACAGVYLLASILSFRLHMGLPGLALIFLPGLRNVSASLVTLYIWIFVIYLRDLFRVRELFESHTRRYRGEDLQRVMLEDSAIMSGGVERFHWTIGFYGFQLALVFLLALICGLLKAPLPLYLRILIILVLTGAAVIFSLLDQFRQEQFFAGEGISAPKAERRKRLGAGIAFCGGAGILAALCASNSNILPISIITAFFAWLAQLLARRRVPEIPPAMPELPRGFGPQPMDMAKLLGVEESEPWPFLDYLPYIVLAVLIVAFLWFMIKPLFTLSPGSGKIPLLLRVARLFTGGFAGLRQSLRDFFASLGKRGSAVGIKISDNDIRNMTEDLLANWSRARKRELRQSLNLFARLILWGGQNYQTVWKPSVGPGEFCAILAAAERTAAGSSATTQAEQAALTADILRCGEIFEEALYGPRPPDKKARREFRELVEKITG